MCFRLEEDQSNIEKPVKLERAFERLPPRISNETRMAVGKGRREDWTHVGQAVECKFGRQLSKEIPAQLWLDSSGQDKSFGKGDFANERG